MGPSSGLAAVAGAAVVTAGVAGGDVATFVAGLTLTTGLLFLVMAVFRMGWLAQFLSRAVVTGFLFGAAIDVVIGELPKLTGTDAEGANSLRELGSWLRTLGEAHTATVVVGVVALVVVFGLKLVAPRVPGRWSFSSAASSRPRCSTWRSAAWPSSATFREGCPPWTFRTSGSFSTTPAVCSWRPSRW